MRFAGQVVVYGSGPSLTPADVQMTRFLPGIAVNSTYELASHCAVVVAADLEWWVEHGDSVPDTMQRISYNYGAEREHRATKFHSLVARPNDYNSGLLAVEYAITGGADRVLLLGMDCSVKHGAHHHADHGRNPTAAACQQWRRQWKRLRDAYPDAQVVNCSRYTELDVFPVVALEVALCGHGLMSAIPSQSACVYLNPG